MPVQSWLSRIKETAATAHRPEARPEDYPDNVTDRLLYVLAPHGPKVKVDIYKGRINAAGTALNKAIRRYEALHALRSAAPAKFIRPIDLELLSALAQARLWETHYSYGLPELFRPKGEDVIGLIRQLCDTGRFLHDTAPGAYLTWSDMRPKPRLAWWMAEDGFQRLGFEDETGQPMEICGMDGAAFWIDTAQGRIGALEYAVEADVLGHVDASPEIAPHEAEALAAALPDTLAGFALPRPRTIRPTRRPAQHRFARLTVGAESARDGPRYWGSSVQLPRLALRFVYDGQEVPEGDADPQLVEDGEVVTLTRDDGWETACATLLMEAGALPVEDLEIHWPGERMMECDFVLAVGEVNLHMLEVSDRRGVLDFAFRTVPELRRQGWPVIETRKWPYRLSEEAASLTVATRTEVGEPFQGNDWFSLGFQAEISGKSVDVAPMVAAFFAAVP